MKRNRLHGTGREVSVLGLGTVKFGRNEQVKYPTNFDLPDDRSIMELLDLAQALEINLLDTAPAYGSSETRLGSLLGNNRDNWVIVTKAGEEFINGHSVFDFSALGITQSVERTLTRLRTDRVETVLLHSDGNDVEILEHSGAVDALAKLKSAGKVLSFGISTKTVAGGKTAVAMGLDVVMITYNPWFQEEEPVLDAALEKGNCSVLIKKALGSGWFGNSITKDPIRTSLKFIFNHQAATAVVTGTINPLHLQANAEAINSITEMPPYQTLAPKPPEQVPS